MEKESTKVKVHTRYELRDGTRVPSVTTVLGILNKPALLDWAWKCGIDGLDYKAVRDHAADVGTLAHYLIMCHLKGEEPDTSEYSEEVIGKAENCLLSYFEWLKEHPIEPILVEVPLVSEKYRFGGMMDCFAKLNGENVLIDHKTGKAIYAEMFYQLAGYRQLLIENGYEVSSCRILRIGRDENESFEDRPARYLGREWDLFQHCLGIYRLQKEIKKGGERWKGLNQ